MITIKQHLEENREAIHTEAVAYARTYQCSYEQARDDIEGEYIQGWHEAADQLRHGDYEQE